MEQTGLGPQLLAHHDSGSSPTTTGEENHTGIPTSTEFFNTPGLEPPFVKKIGGPKTAVTCVSSDRVIFFVRRRQERLPCGARR